MRAETTFDGGQAPQVLPERRPGILAEILADENRLLERLGTIDLVPMLLVHAHLTNSDALLERFRPHIKGPWRFDVNVPAELQDELRSELVKELRCYRDGDRHLPGTPSPEFLHKMLDVAVGGGVPQEYLPLAMDEMCFDGHDPKTVEWREKPPVEKLRGFKAVVIGAGFSGIGMAAKLKEAGIPYVVIEKNDEVGGTWYENSYPGCGVDTPNHFYSYSFRLEANWNYYFARRDEIFRYIKDTAKELDVSKDFRFNEEVLSSVWDAARALWVVRVKRADGSEYELEANVVISATGLLNRPAYPTIPGMDSFKGPLFHSARWDHSVDLAGKKVAMVGTGASGMQIGPAIQSSVEKLTIFQRSPHWALPNALIFEAVGDDVKWALGNLPFYAKWFRLLLLYASSDAFFAQLEKDPNWPHPEKSLNEQNNAIRERLVAHISKELNNDPALIEKAMPKFPPYGKRMLRDNNWYKMLTRPNVDLVSCGIEKITQTGIVDREGVEHPADVILLATGFKAQMPLFPMNIVGTNGSIREQWGEDNPRAYLGITVPDFPNFFIIYGPNTNGGHGGSALFHSECQIRYIMLALREIIERGADSIEVKRDRHDEYNRVVDERHNRMVWSHPGVSNWYRNKHGRVVTNSPWRLVEYRDLTATFEPAEYSFGKVKADA